MNSRLLEHATAGDFSCCGKPGWCAKCKYRFYRDFITPIELAHGESPPDLTVMPLEEFMRLRGWRERLVAEMMPLPIADFMKLRYWADHLRMAFYFINDTEMEASLLRHWLTTFNDDPEFAHFVSASLTRHQHGNDVCCAWKQKAQSLGTRHQ